MKLAEVRKAVTAASGAAAMLVSVGLLSGTAEKWTTGVLAALTAALVYAVPNKAAAPKPAQPADAGNVDVGVILLVCIFIVSLILLFHGPIR